MQFPFFATLNVFQYYNQLLPYYSLTQIFLAKTSPKINNSFIDTFKYQIIFTFNRIESLICKYYKNQSSHLVLIKRLVSTFYIANFFWRHESWSCSLYNPALLLTTTCWTGWSRLCVTCASAAGNGMFCIRHSGRELAARWILYKLKEIHQLKLSDKKVIEVGAWAVYIVYW